jgi:DNA polymerase III subunit epsilon
MKWSLNRKGRAGQAVPGWDSLDLAWREADLWVVDLETTGLDLRQDEVVSWGMVRVRGGRVLLQDAAYGLVRPSRPPSPSAMAVHGLLPAELADAGPPDLAAGELARRLRGGVLVAHAAWVEEAFLARLLSPIGTYLAGPVIDTAGLAREAGLAGGGADQAEPGLEALSGRLGLPVHTPHHALGDALTTAVVALALIAKLEARHGPLTVRDLTAWSRRPR